MVACAIREGPVLSAEIQKKTTQRLQHLRQWKSTKPSFSRHATDATHRITTERITQGEVKYNDASPYISLSTGQQQHTTATARNKRQSSGSLNIGEGQTERNASGLSATRPRQKSAACGARPATEVPSLSSQVVLNDAETRHPAYS